MRLRGDLEKREWFAGLDLASTYDLSALVMVSQDTDGTFDVMPFFWVPQENAAEPHNPRQDRLHRLDS